MGVMLMAGEFHELSRAIGALEATVAKLAIDLADYKDATTREHRNVHDIIEALSDAVRTLTTTVQEMKPLTDDYRERRAEARGAKRLVMAIYTMAAGIAGAAGSEVLRWLTSRPPHP